MAKIVLVLYATILVATLVFGRDFEDEYRRRDKEEYSLETQQAIENIRSSLAAELFLEEAEQLDNAEGTNFEAPTNCSRPMQKCNKQKPCCQRLRCSNTLKRCVPKCGSGQ